MVSHSPLWWLRCLMIVIILPFSESKDRFEFNGSTIVLNCPFNRTYGYPLQWYFRKINEYQAINYSINNTLSTDLDPEVLRRLDIVGNHNIGIFDLQISDIRERDEGNYTCSSYYNEYHQQLYIIARPSKILIDNITQHNRLVGTEDRNVTVLCSAVGGKPPPLVTMSIDGEIVARHYQSAQYTIKIISRALDLTAVKCTADDIKSRYYSIENSSTIFLYLKPLNLTIYPAVVTTEENTALVVNCLSNGSRPAAVINWVIGDMDVTAYSINQTTQDADATYTVTSTLTYLVNRKYNNQTITCIASNEVLPEGRQINRKLFIKIKPSEPIMTPDDVSIEENKPLRVTCVSKESRPAAVIHWTIGQMDVTSNSTSQNIYNFDDTYTVTSTLTYRFNRSYDNTTISCNATNDVLPDGTLAFQKIEIKFAPSITVSTEVFNSTDANRTIKCIPKGNPTNYTYFKWQHLSKYGKIIRELDGDSNGVLTLPDVPKLERYQDTGQYTCTVTNGIIDKDGNMRQSGTGYITVYVTSVPGPPIVTYNTNDIMYGNIGQDVTISVYLYSIPIYARSKWYKRNEEIIGNSYTIDISPVMINCTFHDNVVQLDGSKATLTITNLKEEDFDANYTINISNEFGHIEHSVLLLSASPPLTPFNCSIIGLTTSSIKVDWVPGYNGGSAQTFIVEYHDLKGSSEWLHVRVPPNHEWSGSMSFTIQNLQSATIYEIRIHAVNIFGRSGPTNVITVPTASFDDRDEQQCVSRSLFGGVVGSLVILIVIVIIICFLQSKVVSRFGLKEDLASTKSANSKVPSPAESSKAYYQNIVKTATYENVSGEGDGPKFISEENSKVMSSETTNDMYEKLGIQLDKNIYDDLQRPKGSTEKVYINVNL